MRVGSYRKTWNPLWIALAALLSWSCGDESGDDPAPDVGPAKSSIRIELDYLDVLAEGGEEEVGLEADADWTAVSSVDSWLEVSPASGTSGKDLTLRLRIGRNADSAEREAKVIVRTASGNAADTLTVRQAGVSRYVDIAWGENATLSGFDLTSGEVRISFADSVPAFTPEVSTIVVPTDSLSYIRVVNDVSASGKSVTLRTEEGDMTDLFMDQEFTLSTSPNPDTRLTRSGNLSTTDRDGVIHPSKITARTEDGRNVVLYDALATRAGDVIQGGRHFFERTVDWNGQPIYKWGPANLYWETCEFTSRLDGTFYFAFNSEYEVRPSGLRVKRGTLSNFFFFLDGTIGADLMLALEASGQISHSESMKRLLSDFVNVTFSFPVGPVAVPINLRTDLLADMSVNAEASAKLTTGFNGSFNVKAGVNYMGRGSVMPIFEPSYTFAPYPLTLTLFGSVSAEASVYPYFKIRLFNFAGPNIAYKPFLGWNLSAGRVLSTDASQNFVGWESDLYLKDKVMYNLELDFIGLRWPTELKETDGRFTSVYETPTKVELVSPADGTVCPIGQSVDVRFRVTGTAFNNEAVPTHGVTLLTNPYKGEADKAMYETDMRGEVTVRYTPREEESRLSVYFVDAKGNPITAAVFTPTLDASSIVGTWETSEFEMSVGDDTSDNLGSIKWTNTVTFRSDGTYSYVENPTRKTLNWVSHGENHSWTIYKYCNGTYTYDEETRQLTLQAGPVIDETVEDGKPSSFNGNADMYKIFGTSGMREANLNEDGTLGIFLQVEGGTDVYATFKRPS